MQTLRGMSRFFVILAAVLGLLFSAAPAQAAQVPSSAVSVPTAASVQPYSAKKGSCKALSENGQAAASSSMLPSTRWQDSASTFHSRVDSGFMGTPKWVTIERAGIVTNAMTMGNMLWGWATGLAQSAINFCLADSAFGVIDSLSGSLGKIVTDNMIVAVLIVMSLVGGLFTLYKRGRFPVGEFMTRIGAVALLMLMVSGAMSSTGGGINGSDKPYKPGTFSPGWMVIETQTAVNTIASAPMTKIADNIGKEPAVAEQDGFCKVYAETLNGEYKKQFGAHSATPRSLSTMWEMSGLEAWKNAQYGMGPLNKNVWCMQLEWYGPTARLGAQENITKTSFTEGPNAGSVAEVINKITKKNGQEFKLGSKAFSPQTDVDRDRSIVAWATCQMKKSGDLMKGEGWSVRAEATSEEFKPTTEDCAKWWSDSTDDLKAFDWPTNPDDIRKKGAGNPTLVDFIENVHGEVNTVGKSSSMTYAFASVPMLIVFGFLGLATYAANMGIMLIMMALMVAVMMACTPIRSAGFKSISKVLMTLIGLLLFSLFVRALFTIITLISEVVVKLGSQMFSGGLQMLWTGLAPVLAVVILHLIFTKALKMPSPFTLSGGAAWGKALGGGGGAAALNGMNSMTGKMDNKIGSATKAGSRKVGGAAIGALPGMSGVGARIGGTSVKRAGAAGALDSNTGVSTARGGAAGGAAGAAGALGGTAKRPAQGGAKPRTLSMAEMAAAGRAVQDTESVAMDLEGGLKVDLDGSGRRKGANPLEDGVVDGLGPVGPGGGVGGGDPRDGAADVVDPESLLGGMVGSDGQPLAGLEGAGGGDGEALQINGEGTQINGAGLNINGQSLSGIGGRGDSSGNLLEELAVDGVGATGPGEAIGGAPREGAAPVMDEVGGQLVEGAVGVGVAAAGQAAGIPLEGMGAEGIGAGAADPTVIGPFTAPAATPVTAELPIIQAADPTAGMSKRDKKDFERLGYTAGDISDGLAETTLTNKELLNSTSNFRERGVMRRALKHESQKAKQFAKETRQPLRTRVATSVMEPIQHMRENPKQAAKTIAKGAAIGVGVGLASTVLLPASPLLLPAAAAGAGVLKSRAATKGRQQAAGKVQTDKLTAFRDAQRQQRVKDADRVDQEQEAQLMAQAASQAESDRIATADRDAARKVEEQRNLASAIATAMGTQAQVAPPAQPSPFAEPANRGPLVEPKTTFDDVNEPATGQDGY